MDTNKNSAIKELMNTGIFKSNLDLVMYLLVKSISQREEPIGSWVLKAEIEAQGITSSTATIGRYLKMLDSKGYTILRANQGRTLTITGRVWLHSVEEKLARAKVHGNMREEIQIVEYTELTDLLRARKIIETETARLAALHATREQIDAMLDSTRLYLSCVEEKRDHFDPAIDFHAIIAESSQNKFLKGMLNILLFENRQLDPKIEGFYTIKIGRIYVAEHEKIIRAIAIHDAEQASQLMADHMDRIILYMQKLINKYEEKDKK